jgi:hypothetical protein
MYTTGPSQLIMNSPRWVPRFKDPENRAILVSLLVILSGTIGATSATLPNNTVSYSGFGLLLLLVGIRVWRRGLPDTRGLGLHVYDLVPLGLVLVWLYGFVLGLVNHNPTGGVFRNFAGMALYALYYVFLFARVRKFDLLRCLLIAAAVNTTYMFGFFLYDKVYGPLFGEPRFFRFLDVRAYYSETLVLLMAPIALIVHQLLSPPPEASGALRRSDRTPIVLLYLYLFAFLQISLSKATLLAYLLVFPLAIVVLGRRVVALVRNRAAFRLAAVAGTCLLSVYPLTHLLAYVASADHSSGKTSAPELALSTSDPLAALRTPNARRVLQQFTQTAASHVAADERVLTAGEYAPFLDSGLEGHLIYPGVPSVERDDAVWRQLQRGNPADVSAGLMALRVRHLLLRGGQPRPLVFRFCVHTGPVARSESLQAGRRSSFVFELYQIDECRPPAFEGISTLPPPIAEFVDVVASRVASRDHVWIRPEHAELFEGRVEGLVYTGSLDMEGVTAADLARLEGRTRAEIGEAMGRAGLKYLIVQTAQPPPRMLLACAFDAPIERSAPVGEGDARYAFELYEVKGCRAPLIDGTDSALVQAKIARREMTYLFLKDLHPLGRGLGAPLKGYKRDPMGYGFEQNYLNLLHKFGVFALVIFAAYALACVRIALAAGAFRTRHFAFASAAFLAGLIMGLGNPTLMSPIMVTLHGMVLYWLRPDASVKPWRWLVQL